MNQPDSVAGKIADFDKTVLPSITAKHEPDGPESISYYQ